MSNLELNVPITFDAAAALDISYNITQRVQDAEGQMTSFEQSAEGFNMFYSYLGEQKSGLTITNNDITLSANKTYIKTPGSNAETLFQDGKIKTDYINADAITAKSLNTTGENSNITINNGLITCNGTATNTKIEFGIDDSQNAVLKFILNDVELYNLGPNGLITLDINLKQPLFSSFKLHNSSNYNSCFSIISTNTNSYFLPFYTGTLNSSELDDPSAPQLSINSFQLDYIYPSTGEIYSDEEIAEFVIYNTISKLAYGNNYAVLVQFDNNTTSYYNYSCGFKKISNIKKYFISSESNLLDNEPIYNGKTYKSNTLTDNYITNTSNYINSGYYVNTSLAYGIGNEYNNLPLAPAYYIISGDPIYLNNNSNNIRYIMYDNNAFAVNTDALDFRVFNIYYYNNGNVTKTIKGYIICLYTLSNIGNAYVGYSNNTYWTHNPYYGTGGTSCNIIKLAGNNAHNNYAYGLLCSQNGIIYCPTNTQSFVIDDYVSWLESLEINSGEYEEDEEPLEP